MKIVLGGPSGVGKSWWGCSVCLRLLGWGTLGLQGICENSCRWTAKEIFEIENEESMQVYVNTIKANYKDAKKLGINPRGSEGKTRILLPSFGKATISITDAGGTDLYEAAQFIYFEEMKRKDIIIPTLTVKGKDIADNLRQYKKDKERVGLVLFVSIIKPKEIFCPYCEKLSELENDNEKCSECGRDVSNNIMVTFLSGIEKAAGHIIYFSKIFPESRIAVVFPKFDEVTGEERFYNIFAKWLQKNALAPINICNYIISVCSVCYKPNTNQAKKCECGGEYYSSLDSESLGEALFPYAVRGRHVRFIATSATGMLDWSDDINKWKPIYALEPFYWVLCGNKKDELLCDECMVGVN